MGSCTCGASTWLREGISSPINWSPEVTGKGRTSLQLVPRINRPIQDAYAFKGKLGSGSGGVVYKVRHKLLGTSRAVKTIPKSKGAYIRREIAILEMMAHPHILELHEFFEETKCTHLVTELCRGGDLHDLIQAAGHFTETLGSTLTRQLLDAVGYMHGHGVCHRDLKPENLLLVSKKGPPQEAHLKVCDFGLARTFRKGETFKSRAGTYFFVAPEVVSHYYDERCDLWSCGVIIYTMLSGSLPWEGETEHEVLREIAAGQIDFDDDVWEEVSEAPKELIGMLTQKSAIDRVTAEQALFHKFVKKEPASPSLAECFLRLLSLSNTKDPMQLIQEMCLLLNEAGISELPPEVAEVLRSSDLEFLIEALYACLRGERTDPALHMLTMRHGPPTFPGEGH